MAKEKTNDTPSPPPQKAAFCHICIIRKKKMEAIWYQLCLANQLDFYHIKFLACFASMEVTEKTSWGPGEYLGTLQAALLIHLNLDLQSEKKSTWKWKG